MMNVGIKLSNYRCFSSSNPAIFTLADGFTAFVGPNNGGKSTILRFFRDFRTLFGIWRDDLFSGATLGIGFTLAESLLCNANEDNLVIEFSFDPEDLEPHEDATRYPDG